MAGLISAQDLEELRDSIARILGEMCDNKAIHAFIDCQSDLAEKIWATAAELGWLGIGLPEAYGGLELGTQALDVLYCELGRRLAPGPFISTLAAAQWLSTVAPETVNEQFLPQIAAGNLSLAVPARIDAGASLNRRGSGLFGKLPILGSETADLVVAPVATDGRISEWALLSRAAGTVELAGLDTWDRTRQICTLTCEDAAAETIISDPDGAVGRMLARHLSLALASDSIGGAAAIAHQTITYMKDRIQFDRAIGSFQALKHRAADLIASLATTEQLVAQGVESCAMEDPDADMWAALAKAAATDAYVFIAGDCVQLHGGVGHTWEFNVHIHVKRARMNESLGASSCAQRDFAAKALADATRACRSTTELAL